MGNCCSTPKDATTAGPCTMAPADVSMTSTPSDAWGDAESLHLVSINSVDQDEFQRMVALSAFPAIDTPEPHRQSDQPDRTPSSASTRGRPKVPRHLAKTHACGGPLSVDRQHAWERSSSVSSNASEKSFVIVTWDDWWQPPRPPTSSPPPVGGAPAETSFTSIRVPSGAFNGPFNSPLNNPLRSPIASQFALP